MEKHQGEDLMDIKVEVKVEPEEETDLWADHQSMRKVKEEIPGAVVPDGVIDRNPPERCPRPLYSQDCPEGNVPEKHQDEDLIKIKVEVKTEPEEEMDFGADQQYGVIDRNPPERCPRPLYSQDCPEGNVPEKHQNENVIDVKAEVKDEVKEETVLLADQQYGVIDRNPPERCPRPLYSQDCPEGNVPEKHQVEDLINIKVEVKDESEEEEDFWPEKIPGGVVPGNPSKNSEENFLFLNDKGEYEDTMERSSAEKPYSCSECGKCFKQKSDLLVHERIHTGEKPYLCSECGKCFLTKSELVLHERIHTEKPYSCSECGKCFITKFKLVLHERSHTVEKPYSCSECEQCFTSKVILDRHERSHAEKKPCVCSECGKRCITKAHLDNHKKTHTEKKLFSCSDCGKGFKIKLNLAIHERTHTGEKPYSCLECGTCFTQKAALVVHERKHTLEKPYPCSECGKRFQTKFQMSAHERIHTGD